MPTARRRLHIRVRDKARTLQSVDLYVAFSAPTNDRLEAKWVDLVNLARAYLRAGLRDELLIELGKTPRGKGAPIGVEPGDLLTVEDAWRAFEPVGMVQNSPAERASKRTAWRRHIEPKLGSRAIADLKPRDVEAWRAQLVNESGLSRKTADNVLTILRRIFAWAVESELLTASPVEKVKIFGGEPIESDNYLMPDQIDQLLVWLHEKGDPAHRFVVELTFRAGLRYGEIAALSKRDLDVQAGVVHIRKAVSLKRDGEEESVKTPKGRRAKAIGIGKPFAAELFRWSLGHASQLLIPSPMGERLAKTTMRRWLEAACSAAEVPRISPHGLRHSYGTWLASKGFSQAQIAKMLRHSDVKTAARYAHVLEAAMMAAALWPGSEDEP